MSQEIAPASPTDTFVETTPQSEWRRRDLQNESSVLVLFSADKQTFRLHFGDQKREYKTTPFKKALDASISSNGMRILHYDSGEEKTVFLLNDQQYEDLVEKFKSVSDIPSENVHSEDSGIRQKIKKFLGF